MTTEEYWFWLCNIKDLYQKDICKLLQVFHSPEEIYKSSEDVLQEAMVLDPGKIHAIVMSKNNYRSMYRLERLKKDGIQFVYYGSEKYPVSLLTLEDKPYSLYVKGNLPDPEYPTAGVVGARSCSGYGKEMTLKFSQTLAANGVQIISGMAVGVDSFASRGALEVGGKTFAVLGSGLDVIYPPQNIELYYQIILNGGGVISEYPMGTAPVGWQFPHRNRLISALSDKLLVMEARKHSGTLTTVSYALAQGKDIYALPGRLTDLLSEGCNRLIADGAGVLINPVTLLEEFYPGGMGKEVPYCIGGKTSGIPGINGKVLRELNFEPRGVEEIAKACALSIQQAASVLAELELKGLCCQLGQDQYVLEK